MTKYRGLMETLGLEVLGCPSDVCLLANDKYVTKQVCNAAGVNTPKGELLLRWQHEDLEKLKEELLTRWSVPFIVKPAREDNSFGVSLVKTEDDVVRCLENAFKYDQRVLVEQYIAGREVRVVALEWENEEGMSLEVLPKIEYFLEDILFCSFSPLSVVVGLAAQSPDEKLQPHPKLFEKLMERSARLTRERRARGSAPADTVVGSPKA